LRSATHLSNKWLFIVIASAIVATGPSRLLPQATGLRRRFCHAVKASQSCCLFRLQRSGERQAIAVPEKGIPMKKRNGLLLVTLFMALMMSDNGGWRINVSDVRITLNVNQSR